MNTKKLPRRKELSPSPLSPAQVTPRSNLVLWTTRVEAVPSGVFEQPSVGIPIMPEGFVTETGIIFRPESLL